MVFIINSAPGVGKSTLLRELQHQLPDGFALLDGDDVGRTVPLENNLEWLNLIQDNLASCCVNFRKYGKTHMVLSFVLPSEERVGRLSGLLEKEGFQVCHITLFCQEHEVERRITERNTSKLIKVSRAVELNQSIGELESDFRLDTTTLGINEVSDRALTFIQEKISAEPKVL